MRRAPVSSLLAAGHVAQVHHLPCGHVVISVGPLSLRLEPAALRDLAETLGAATLQLDARPGHRLGYEGEEPDA